MAPTPTALQVTLSDGTKLQVIRDGYRRSINHLEPSDTLLAKLKPFLESHPDQSLSHAEILEQFILPALQIYAVGERTPQFKADEIVSLVLKGNEAGDKVQLFGGDITGLKRP